MSRIARNSVNGWLNRNTFCSGAEVVQVQCKRALVAFFTTAFIGSLCKCSFLRNFNQVILDFMSRMRQHKLHPSKQQSLPSDFSLFCGQIKRRALHVLNSCIGFGT